MHFLSQTQVSYSNICFIEQKNSMHFNQDNIYEITMNCYQAKKISEMGNVIFGLQLRETVVSVKAELSTLKTLNT